MVIAYDGTGTHVYRRDCDVVFDEARIAHVGPGYQGAADTDDRRRGFMVIPGLVNVHSHPFSEPANKGLTDEVGSPTSSARARSTNTCRCSASTPRHAGPLDRRSRSELLKSGVTTIADLSIAARRAGSTDARRVRHPRRRWRR